MIDQSSGSSVDWKMTPLVSSAGVHNLVYSLNDGLATVSCTLAVTVTTNLPPKKNPASTFSIDMISMTTAVTYDIGPETLDPEGNSFSITAVATVNTAGTVNTSIAWITFTGKSLSIDP